MSALKGTLNIRVRRSPMSKGTVLVLGSNATRIEVQGGRTGPTGNYLNETVVPAMAFIEAGYDLVLATPNGTKAHIDEASDSPVHFGGDQSAPCPLYPQTGRHIQVRLAVGL